MRSAVCVAVLVHYVELIDVDAMGQWFAHVLQQITICLLSNAERMQ